MMMPLFAFLGFEMAQHILGKMRWILPLPIAAFVAYMTTGALLIQAKNFSLPVNVWDALFGFWANQRLVFFILTPLYCYLVSDLLPEPDYGQAMLLRIGSRRRWWQGKVLALGLAVLSYVGLNLLILAAVATFVLPWERTWSPFASQYPLEAGLHSTILTLPPSVAIGAQLLLLSLWWFSLGLLVILLAQRFHRSVIGFLVGVLISLIGAMDWYGMLPADMAKWTFASHLFLNIRAIEVPTMGPGTILGMVLYWLIWTALFYALGLSVSRRWDFYQTEHRT